MKVTATAAVILMMFVSLQAQIPDFTPQTPLIGALLHSDAAEAARLLQKGADPNEGRFASLPPVILAAARQDVELVRLMAARGADLNVRDRSGATALMWGAFNDNGSAAMVEALIALGADPFASNKAGETALDWALRRGETAAVAALRKAGISNTEGTRSSARKALALLERSGAQFSSTSKCSSCHHQSLPQMALGIARTRGLDVDVPLARTQVDSAISQLKAVAAEALQNRDRIPDPPIAISYALVGFAATGHPRDEVTAAMAEVVSAWQDDNGRFHSLPPIRPPLESSDITATALSLRAIQLYGSHQEHRVARAVDWLRAAKPQTTEEHAMQLLGLAWGHGRRHDITEVHRVTAGTSATGRRMGPVAGARDRRVRDRAGARCTANQRVRRNQPAVPAWYRLSPPDAVSRRLLARPLAHLPGAVSEGQRIPSRNAPVDLGCRHELGDHGTVAGIAASAARSTYG